MPAENHLLAALSEEVRSRLFGQLELVALALGNVLYESGDTLRHVYFPTDSIIIPALRDEARCVGGDLCSRQQRADRRCVIHGRRKPPSRAMVQSAGSAFRIEGQRLNDEFNRHVELLVLMLRTPGLYSRKRSRLPSATDTTRSISHCAADSCCLWTACRATN